MIDHLDIPLNPGIVRTVRYLQEAGFETVDSGDGKTHACQCDRDHAYVTMIVPSHSLLAEADRLRRLLESRGLRFGSENNDPEMQGEWPSIQASYDPVDGSSILDLAFVDDKTMFGMLS